LEGQPYPHFEAHPTRKGLLIRIEADGRKTVGRFKNRQFVEASDEACKPVKRPVARKVRRIGRSLAASKRMPKGRAVAAAHAL
jgi:hypothetical protein